MALVTVQRSPSPSNTDESEDVDTEEGSNLKSPNRSRSFSESYFTVKGAALILPQNDVESTYTKKICKNSYGDIQSHLECMIALLRRQDTIALAVKLEVNSPDRHKYMAVVSCMGKQDTEESVILGIDFYENKATIGLVLPIWGDTHIALDGDGGFTIKSGGNTHMFKPVTVQVMWFTLQSLNKLVKIARDNKYICGGLSHTWVSYYTSSINSDIRRISEWNITEDILFFKAEPVLLPSDDDDEAFLKRIKVELKNVMMKEDLDEATSKYLRTKLEEQMNMKLDKWKSFIDQEMLTILGQMDSPTKIKDYLYLGSEWNASNIEELTKNGIAYIMNISREIDNFFPGILHYYNIKEWDSEGTDLLKYWEHTHKFINKVRDKKSKVLVHCKMGISRSACTVLAYLMKEFNMTRQEAYDMVKEKRSCIMPNKSFWHQLETYEGILSASNQRHIFKQRSELNMAEKAKDSEKDQIDSAENFLGGPLEHWTKEFDESYSDVFLKDPQDSCSNDIDEIASSSRSADSNEEFYPDLPSPQPEGAVGGVDYIDDDSEESSSSEDDIDMTDLSPLQKSPDGVPSLSPSLKSPEIVLTLPPSEKSSVEKANLFQFGNKTSLNKMTGSDLDIAKIEGDSVLEPGKCIEPSILEDYGVKQHYLKENIPWSAGTVQKTRNSLESKSKAVDADSLSRSESISRSDSVSEIGARQRTGSMSYPTDNAEGKIAIVTNNEIKSENWILSIDGATETETNVDKLTDKKSDPMVEEQKGPSSFSVYEVEDIHLPPGIVRRTTQEIEEKNRFSEGNSDAVHAPLHRSSSLKTDRDTPCKKRRNSERRKTITPILSPSSSITSDITSPTTEITSAENIQNDKNISMSSPCLEDKGQVYESSLRKEQKVDSSETKEGKVDSKEDSNEIADLAVYKFLGEEVSVEKGIVKRQKMGIELLTERQSSEHEGAGRAHRSPESDLSNPVTPTESKTFKKENNVDSATSVEGKTPPGNQKSATDDTFLKNKTEKPLNSPESESVEEHIPEFSKTKENFERAIARTKDEEPSITTPKFTKRPQPRFDAQTLELIREIGSAILNSPQKSELEEKGEEAAAMESGLVRHFVRNIERKTQELKKKKEIIIIDKDSHEKKTSWRWSSPSGQPIETSPGPSAKKSLSQSLSSPVLSSKNISHKGDKSSPVPIGGSPPQTIALPSSPKSISCSPQKGGLFSRSPQKDVSSIQCAQVSASDSSDEENILDVKNLVGKYEGCQCVRSGNHGNTPSLPGIKEDNSSESLKGHDQNKKIKSFSESDSLDSPHRDSDSEDPTNEDCVQLRKIRNQLKKTSQLTHRPKSVEVVRRRNSALPGINWFGDDADGGNQSGFSLEGRKVRKLQGKSHPLTKLELRRKFYNTM